MNIDYKLWKALGCASFEAENPVIIDNSLDSEEKDKAYWIRFIEELKKEGYQISKNESP